MIPVTGMASQFSTVANRPSDVICPKVLQALIEEETQFNRRFARYVIDANERSNNRCQIQHPNGDRVLFVYRTGGSKPTFQLAQSSAALGRPRNQREVTVASPRRLRNRLTVQFDQVLISQIATRYSPEHQ